ncbi:MULTISPECIES: response regulator transcription factor [Aeromonas]|uniref:response regulator transcription factor n=1 Tax=Aeromonas TaxID=642 RepID=UPI000CDD3077|nr:MULTISPECIES: response regulator [Aeromonas]AUZ74037.1 DNA-binding response regulator [Aeromonas sp. ASNIH4]POU41767.1 DNA-binding response regulator [Aeromonas hydrophila]POV85024.1 DNA-binding response regulator [Aeromonas sp. ASNIH6]
MPPPARPPLYLVDDDEAVLDSLRFMLESCDERPLFSFADGERFLAEVDLHQPASLILDCRMPGLSGPEVQQRLKAAQSPIAILFLTGHGEVPLAVESLKQGAVDFLQKPVQLAPLLAAIARAEQATLSAATRFAQLAAYQRLTPREHQLLQLIARGHKNQQIAQDLCISVRTVEVCRASLMKRLEVDSLAELMLLYANVHSAP